MDKYILLTLVLGCCLPWLLRFFFKHWAANAVLFLLAFVTAINYGFLGYREAAVEEMVSLDMLFEEDMRRVYLSWFLKGVLISSGVIFGMTIFGRSPKEMGSNSNA